VRSDSLRGFEGGGIITLIVFFSGTGNTEYSTRVLKEELEKLGDRVMRIEVEEIRKVPDHDRFVLAYPIHACDCPKLVSEFTKSLDGRHRVAYLLLTCAKIAGGAPQRMRKILEAAGYDFKGFLVRLMTPNDAALFIKEGSKLSKMIIRKVVDDDLKNFAKAIVGNESFERGRNRLSFLYEWVFFLLKKIVYPVLSKRFCVNDSCNLCRLCEMTCPIQNITIADRVVFHDKCILCLRCISTCPKEAIQIGKLTQGTMRWRGPLGDYRPPILRKSVLKCPETRSECGPAHPRSRVNTRVHATRICERQQYDVAAKLREALDH